MLTIATATAINAVPTIPHKVEVCTVIRKSEDLLGLSFGLALNVTI